MSGMSKNEYMVALFVRYGTVLVPRVFVYQRAMMHVGAVMTESDRRRH